LGWTAQQKRKGERGIRLLNLGRKRGKGERIFEINIYKQNSFEFKFEKFKFN
jgi:hypothetical protein